MFDTFIKKLVMGPLYDSTEINVFLIDPPGPNYSDHVENRFVVQGSNVGILEKADAVIDIISQSKIAKHVINVMGGEIFNDGIGTHWFIQYSNFYERIRKACWALRVEFQINWVTDFIFVENREMVQWLMDKCGTKSKIATRYPFIGSGMSLNNRMVLQKNIELYKKHIDSITVVLDKPNINGLILGKDRFFNEVVYTGFPTNYGWHDPANIRSKALPAAQEIVEGVMAIEKKYPAMKRYHTTPKHILKLLLE